MKNKAIPFIFFGCQGAAVVAITLSIQRWGKVAPAKEGVLISIALALVTIPFIFLNKNKQAFLQGPNPGAPGIIPGTLYDRHPLLARSIAMIAGLVIGVTALLLLESAN